MLGRVGSVTVGVTLQLAVVGVDRGQVVLGGVFQPDHRVTGPGQRGQDLIQFALHHELLTGLGFVG